VLGAEESPRRRSLPLGLPTGSACVLRLRLWRESGYCEGRDIVDKQVLTNERAVGYKIQFVCIEAAPNFLLCRVTL
jgi:hypothetical protein